MFRLFYDVKRPYCEIYDSQTWMSQLLRVSSALTTESAKEKLLKIPEQFPDFWRNLTRVFPEAKSHVLYFDQMGGDIESWMKDKEPSFSAIYAWLDKELEGGRLSEDKWRDCYSAVQSAERVRKNSIAQGRGLPFGFIPLLDVWASLRRGEARRGIQRTYPREYAKAHYEFEGLRMEDWDGKS